MVKFLEMVANLKFEEKPNYDKFRQLLRQGLKDGGYADDGALVFPNLNKGSTVRSPPKKRNVPQPPSNEETENGNVKQRAKTSIKKSREPCSPRVTNRYIIISIYYFKPLMIGKFILLRTTRRANMSPDCSSDTSSQSSSTLVTAKKKSEATEKKESKAQPARTDTSLSNPTPAILAILARRRNKEETPSPALPSKRKQARSDPCPAKRGRKK